MVVCLGDNVLLPGKKVDNIAVNVDGTAPVAAFLVQLTKPEIDDAQVGSLFADIGLDESFCHRDRQALVDDLLLR